MESARRGQLEGRKPFEGLPSLRHGQSGWALNLPADQSQALRELAFIEREVDLVGLENGCRKPFEGLPLLRRNHLTHKKGSRKGRKPGGDDQLLSRAWLIDPSETQLNTSTSVRRQREPWNGEFYVSFGDPVTRSWADAREYGFVSAGGALVQQDAVPALPW